MKQYLPGDRQLDLQEQYMWLGDDFCSPDGTRRVMRGLSSTPDIPPPEVKSHLRGKGWDSYKSKFTVIPVVTLDFAKCSMLYTCTFIGTSY